jgi:hypothetical protein
VVTGEGNLQRQSGQPKDVRRPVIAGLCHQFQQRHRRASPQVAHLPGPGPVARFRV